jgi:hypothetical protein
LLGARRTGATIPRWVSAALLEAEKHVRRVRSLRDMRHLIASLEAFSPHVTEESKVA